MNFNEEIRCSVCSVKFPGYKSLGSHVSREHPNAALKDVVKSLAVTANQQEEEDGKVNS